MTNFQLSLMQESRQFYEHLIHILSRDDPGSEYAKALVDWLITKKARGIYLPDGRYGESRFVILPVHFLLRRYGTEELYNYAFQALSQYGLATKRGYFNSDEKSALQRFKYSNGLEHIDAKRKSIPGRENTALRKSQVSSKPGSKTSKFKKRSKARVVEEL